MPHLACLQAIHNGFDKAPDALAALGHANNFNEAARRHAIDRRPGHGAGLAQVQEAPDACVDAGSRCWESGCLSQSSSGGPTE